MNQNNIAYKANSIQISPEETDRLLIQVEEKLFVQKNFDFNDHKTIALMVESMGDSRGMMRLKFAERLGIVGKPATPFLLEALANHSNPVVRRASAKTLTLIADPENVPHLIYSLLHDEDLVVKNSCIGALARTGKASVPELLKIIANESDEALKGHAAWALAFIGSKAEEYLYQALNSDSIDVRCAVINALGSLVQERDDENALKILVDSLQDSEPIIRSEAAAILSKINRPEVVDNLLASIDDSSAEVRKAIALALMKIGNIETIKPLEQALQNETEDRIKPIFTLAINQIKRNADLTDDDW